MSTKVVKSICYSDKKRQDGRVGACEICLIETNEGECGCPRIKISWWSWLSAMWASVVGRYRNEGGCEMCGCAANNLCLSLWARRVNVGGS
jgi:hypothetical protein